ncbi:MAG: hypothetical protein ACKOPO_10760 [Novosphingobium sp.]
MKVLQNALTGVALVAMLAAAPALAERMHKNPRTVIRIDHDMPNAQPGQPGSVTQGTAGSQGLLLPAVQKMRAGDLKPQPRRGGVNVAAGDLNGDGHEDTSAPSKPPVSTHAKGPAYPASGSINRNPPRPQQTSTQGPYQLNRSQAATGQVTLKPRKAGEGQF